MAGILILIIVVAFIIALCVAGTIGRRRAAGPGRFAFMVLLIWVAVAGLVFFLAALAFGLMFSP